MIALIVLTLLALTVTLTARMLREGFREDVELFSLRNLFLTGFMLFQLTSAVTTLIFNDFGQLWPLDPARSALIFTVMSVIFLMLFLVSYRRGWGVLALARRYHAGSRPVACQHRCSSCRHGRRRAPGTMALSKPIHIF